jgi:hypothetical protein
MRRRVLFGVLLVGAAVAATAEGRLGGSDADSRQSAGTQADGAPSSSARLRSPERVALPRAPRQGYSIPKGAVRVRTAARLHRALRGRALDIVLEDGTYASDSPFDASGKRLYARHVGKAVIAAGVNLGSNRASAGQLYGLKITTSSEGQLAPLSGAVTTWGAAGGVVQDVEIDGGRVAWYGVRGTQPDGMVVERVVVRNVLSDGVRLSDNRSDSTAVIRRVRDVRVTDADHPEGLNGTGEACIWIGHRVREVVRRVEARRCGWMGLWTGNVSRETIIEDVTIADTRTGIYSEHRTRRVLFRRLDVTAAGTGFNVEWWYDGSGSSDLAVEQFTITAGNIGIFLDAGTYGTSIRRGKVKAPDGIGHPAHLVDPGRPNVIERLTIDLSGVPGRKVWQHENRIG